MRMRVPKAGGCSAFAGGVFSCLLVLAVFFQISAVGTHQLPHVWRRMLPGAQFNVPVAEAGSCPRPSCSNASHFDALVVAGGGQTPTGPSPHVVLRLQKALEIFFAQEPRPFIITPGRGTWHKLGPRDERGFEFHEAAMNADWLIERGVPQEMVLEENSSMETVGNAFFVRVLHADVLELEHLAVINNGWHMTRTQDIFSHVFSVPSRASLCAAEEAGAGGGRSERKRPLLTFITCESGLDPEVERQRLAREAESIPNFAAGSKWQKATGTLESLHLWLHRENLAYSPQGRKQRRAPINPHLAKSY